MIVVRTDIPDDYFSTHPGHQGIDAAAKQYRAWLTLARNSVWQQPTDVTRSHPKASILKAGRVVFNIKANSYRLVCQVNYAAETVEIRVFGTHSEYDQIDAETV